MCPSLIEIRSKTAEKNSAQKKQTDKQTDTTKIMVTWPGTKSFAKQFSEIEHVGKIHEAKLLQPITAYILT